MRKYPLVVEATRGLTSRIMIGIVGCLSVAGSVQAGEIFKSVDADGNVVYSDHLDPSLSQSSLVQLDDAETPPKELHFCWTNCFTLILDNGGVYRRADGTAESWTVETFSPTSIVLHRHDAPDDWNGHSDDVVYAGQASNDRLIGVTVNGKPTNGVDFSWGSALNTLPGSNAERDGKTPTMPDAAPVPAVTSDVPPPPLPEEEQPALPEDGLLWTPGYWYWREQAYVWVSGVWMRPPQMGTLWTPGYWRKAGPTFMFHPGYWGPTVGYYGGANYGHGYSGVGFTGGHWVGNAFAYNSAVNHVDGVVARHTYSQQGQTPRTVQNYAPKPVIADSSHAATSMRSTTSVVRKTPTAPAIDHTLEPNPSSRNAEKPANSTRSPANNAPPRPAHVTPSRTASTKP